jgi:hypothetical protein
MAGTDRGTIPGAVARNQAVGIDAGAAAEVIAILAERGLSLIIRE